MQPYFTYSAACPCGWTIGENLKSTVDEYVKHHKSRCDIWVKK